MRMFSLPIAVALLMAVPAVVAMPPGGRSPLPVRGDGHAVPNDVYPTATVLHNFGATATDVQINQQSFNFIQARDGAFYGTASEGGANTYGGIYRFTADGTYAVVYNFTESTSINSGFTEGSDGNLYFEAYTSSDNYAIYAFNIARMAILFTIPEGGVARGGLAPDGAGNLYGISYEGGKDYEGSIFKLTFNGSYPQMAPVLSTVYSFTGGDDGGLPKYGPVLASDGYWYGTTTAGCGTDSNGGVYQFNPATLKIKRLACFESGLIYQDPVSSLVEASDHNLYGVAGTSAGGYGGVCSVDLASGALGSTYNFTTAGDPAYPALGTPFTDNSGNLLITSAYGGPGGSGALADITTGGGEEILHSFSGDDPAGYYLLNVGIFGSDGNIYGTTSAGGANNIGTLFRVPAGASPVISLAPGLATVDAGQSFTLDWSVLNAFSLSAQSCYASSDDWSFSGAVAGSGSMTITPANPGTHTYGFTCGGVESAVATVDVQAGQIAISGADGTPVSSYSFGAVPESTSPAAYAITVTNDGYVAFPVALAKTGSTSGHFSSTDDCGGSIAAHTSCHISFGYTAPSGPESDAAAFQIEPHGFTFSPGTSTFYLYAHSSAPGAITLSADDHSYGAVAVGSNNAYTLKVYNGTGQTQAFSLGGTVITGGTSQGTTSTTCSSTLAVNAECTITYIYSPSTSGKYEYDIQVTSPATVTPAKVVKLTGTAS